MSAPNLAANESLRLKSLRDLNVVDTPIEERFERLTRMAQQVLGVKMCAVSLVEAGRQWFKSMRGCDATETSRDISFCGHAILCDDLFIVPDARLDDRFKDNPLVNGDTEVVFYAGCPITLPNGSVIGSFCVCDSQPRTLDENQKQLLRDLANIAARELSTARVGSVQAAVVQETLPTARAGLIDPQTRVWSRSGVIRCAEAIATAAVDANLAWGLCLVTIHGLDAMREAMGPDEYDDVLKQAARRLLSGAREIDVLGRFSTSQFLIVLGPSPESEMEQAIGMARLQLCDGPIQTKRQKFSAKAEFVAKPFPPGTAVDAAMEIAALENVPAMAG